MGAYDAHAMHSDEKTVPRRERESVRVVKKRGGWGFAMFLLVILLLAVAAALGFYYLVHQPLVGEAASARRQVTQLEREAGASQARLERLEQEHAAAVAERNRLEGQHGELLSTVQEREAQIAALEAAQREIQERFGAEIASGNVHITGGGGRLSVGLSDRILFASGEAALSEQGKALLRRVAESLKEIEGRVIHVEGHTDAMRPSRALQERFPTNWELSAARATNVVRFLSEECGISGERLVASGLSEFQPAASNRSEAGRRRNRRIELNLLPVPTPAR